jgi:ABC-type glycerol-3-phosphate transport system substrate-binding protein
MSTPAETTVGFDPLLTGWLRKSNAAQVPQVTTDWADEAINFVYEAATGKVDSTFQQKQADQTAFDVAMAGGSPADIAQAKSEVYTTFATAAPTDFSGFYKNLFSGLSVPDLSSFSWQGVVIVALALLLLYVILKEVL